MYVPFEAEGGITTGNPVGVLALSVNPVENVLGTLQSIDLSELRAC